MTETSTPPPDLITALAAQGLDLRGRRWSLLRGGRTNRLWRVTDRVADLVVKLYGPDDGATLFPNDAAAEAACLTHLAPALAVPRLRHRAMTPLGPVIIYDHLPGPVAATPPEAVGLLLRRLHALTPPDGLRHVADGSIAIAAEADALLAEMAGEPAEAIRRLRPVHGVAPSGARAMLHGDVVPANIVAAAQGPVLIDWQCPALGDPCHDLAIYLSPAMQHVYAGAPLTRRQHADFIAGYGNAAVTNRLLRLLPWFHFYVAAHCLWRLQNGDTAYQTGLEFELAALSESVLACP